MRRAVQAIAFLAASGGLRAGATPPPLTESEEVLGSNTQEAADALDPCGKAATRAGVYGAVEVNIINGRRPALALGETRFLRAADVACIRRALPRARLEPYSGRRFEVRRWLPFGEVRPLFPAALLPAWKATVGGHGGARGTLASLLPKDVRLSSPSCLHLRGPEPLEQALDAWLKKVGRAPASAPAVPSYALPDGWWIRVDEHWRMTDELAGKVDDEICLDRVGAAVSALRRDYVDRPWVWGWEVAFEAEWVVDADGRVVGASGFCMVPARDGRGYTPAEVQSLRTEFAGRLSGLDFGRRRGYERIVMRYGPEEIMHVESRTASAPIGPGESAIEARCNRREALQCARDSSSYSPIEIDRLALIRCADTWPKGGFDLAVDLQISPDGRVDDPGLYSMSVRDRRGPRDRGPTVPAALSSCAKKVFRRVRFSASPGGACRYSVALSAFM